VVTYISGFVARKLIKKLDCEPCISSLVNCNGTNSPIRSDFILLEAKNNGGLFIPSDDLITCCRITELVIREVSNKGLRKMKNKTILELSMRNILDTEAFNDLRTTSYMDHKPLGNHVFELIKLIVLQYSKVRLHHMAKERTLSLNKPCVRNKLTKTILFKGQ
jgi:hypothetical protein